MEQIAKCCKEKNINIINAIDSGFDDYGYKKKFNIDTTLTKKVLITGANSYIGENFKNYAEKYYPNLQIDVVDMIGNSWKNSDFSNYDAIFHVAGIAHVDIKKVTNEEKKQYYAVNADLAVETAIKAKTCGVKQFIYLSSTMIYGDSFYKKHKLIDEYTIPSPTNFYADSKWKGDIGIRRIANELFNVAILRIPMVYGHASKGNFSSLIKLGKISPIFPDIDNQHSMIYIENLCEFVCLLVLSGKGGIYFPQNEEYSNTSELVKEIGLVAGQKIYINKIFNLAVDIASIIPGKTSTLVNKAFGNNICSQKLSNYDGLEYRKVSLKDSIWRSVNGKKEYGYQYDNKLKRIWIIDHYSSEPEYGGISRHYDFAKELGKKGYQVVVIASGFSHFTHSYISEREILVKRVGKHVRYVYLKTCSYESNSGISRARNMIDFMNKVIKYEKVIAKKYGKPDAVLGCSVHPLTWIAAYKIAHKYKIRFCIEVRDFWPRSWIDSGEKKFFDPMVIFFAILETWAFKKADKIVYSMYHGDKYICQELKVARNKVERIGQPMDCKRFDKNANKEELLTEEIKKFIKGSFICSFTGYYMSYEGVYVMLEALKILEMKNLPIKMIFVGSGEERDGMLEFVRKNGLKNVLIHDRISKEAIPALLSRSDICMAHLEMKGHKEAYRYGTSKNKVNEYLYSGACTLFGFYDKDNEVSVSEGGITFEPYNPEDLAEKIEKLYYLSEGERKKYGINGRKYIWDNHKAEILAEKMIKVLFE